jgi:tRNA nucleotidyltransferase (CCA-adding enzyme)
MVATLSGQRVGAELRLALREDDPLATLQRVEELGVARAIHPGLALDAELARRALALLPPGGSAEAVVLAAFTRGLSVEELPGLLTRLGFTTREARAAVALAGDLPAVAQELAAARGPAEIAGLLGRRTVEEVALAGGLGAPEHARRWLGDLRHVGLSIDGADLLAAGVPEGPAIGFALLRALAAKLEGQARTPEEELAAALLAAREHPSG